MKVNLKKSAHCKLIVRILFTFPEGPGVLELVYFVGSIIAAGETDGTANNYKFSVCKKMKSVFKCCVTHSNICSGTPFSLN